jgi:hypothetical protein
VALGLRRQSKLLLLVLLEEELLPLLVLLEWTGRLAPMLYWWQAALRVDLRLTLVVLLLAGFVLGLLRR